MKINYELLEDRITTLRMHAGDSQQDLADAIGVTRATVSAIENCSKTEAPSAEMIITIAQHYHVSVDYLIECISVYSGCCGQRYKFLQRVSRYSETEIWQGPAITQGSNQRL